MSQENTGVAGRKNWEVSGTRRANIQRVGMRSLKGNRGTCMRVVQNNAFIMWRTYIRSERCHWWDCNLCSVTDGESDVSSNDAFARSACQRRTNGFEDEYRYRGIVFSARMLTEASNPSFVRVVTERSVFRNAANALGFSGTAQGLMRVIHSKSTHLCEIQTDRT
jgi:hypothetical protein